MTTTTDYPPLEGKNWEIEARKLTILADHLAIAAWFASNIFPDDELPPIPPCVPALSDRARAVVALYEKDENSTRAEIRQTILWALAAYREAVTADELAWATSALKAIWGEQYAVRGADVLAKESRKLTDAMRAFEKSTSVACGYATATMAAVVARYYGPDYVLDTRWSPQVDDMARAERDLYALKQKGAA